MSCNVSCHLGRQMFVDIVDIVTIMNDNWEKGPHLTRTAESSLI